MTESIALIPRLMKRLRILPRSSAGEPSFAAASEPIPEVFDNAPVGFHSIDANGLILGMNDTELRWLGYNREDVIGRKTIFDLESNRSRAAGREAFGRFRESGRIENLELELVARDGSVVPVLLNGTAVRDRAGRFLFSRSIAVHTGLLKETEAALRRSEESLRSSENRYRTLVENLGEGICQIDPDGTVRFANGSAERIFGAEPGRLAGRSLGDFAPDGSRPSPVQPAAGWRPGGRFESEMKIRKPDGEIRTLDVTAVPGFAPAGEFLGALAVFRDVTVEKQERDELFQSRQMLQLVLNHIPSRIFWKDRLFRYLGCNLPFARDAGLSDPSGVTGKDDFELSWKDTAERYRNDDRSVMETDLPKLDFEEPQDAPGGEPRWLRTSKVPLHDPRNRVIGVLGIYEDVTENKRAKEALERSLREKEILLKEIHHRVKNNMQIVSSLLHLQSAHVDDPRSAEMFRESHQRIRSMAIVHEKLYRSGDLAAIQADDYIRTLAIELSRIYRRADVELKHELEPMHIGVDFAVPFGLIVNELVSNAFKHAFPAGFKSRGEIRIGLDRRNDGKLRLRVEDDGVGLPVDFDVQSGRSLGMKLIQLLAVDQLGGTMRISRDGGTAFVFHF
jgi:PAS domain S-box-containing protein